MRASPDRRRELITRLRAAGCVFAEDEARILLRAAADVAALDDMVARRCAGEPLEHVTGTADFCGLHVHVDAGVFVPRHRSEALVRRAAALLPSEGAVVVDMCCGTGALGLALLRLAGPFELHAADSDIRAVRCARRNVGTQGRVHHGDLLSALPRTLRGRVDVMLANVPYVPTADIDTLPREARLHEPRGALDGGADGLDILRRLAADVAQWLHPGGHVLVETSIRQAPVAARLLEAAGLAAASAFDRDLEATVVYGGAPGLV